MEKEFLQKSLYELLYNNLLLPRTHEITCEEKREVFDGTTESLVELHRGNQISFDQFCNLSQSQIIEIVQKSKDLPIDRDRFFALVDMLESY